MNILFLISEFLVFVCGIQQELKEISKIIDNGLYNIALAKAVQGGAYMCEAVGENMVDVGKRQYTEFIR